MVFASPTLSAGAVKLWQPRVPAAWSAEYAIRSGKADAVFDEGVKSWGAEALNAGRRVSSLYDVVLRKMEKIGFPSAMLTRKHYPKMDQDIRTLDFSGWTFFRHADLPFSIAYNMAKAVDLCYKRIPVDHFDKRPMTMREFCQGGEAGQLNILLIRGQRNTFAKEVTWKPCRKTAMNNRKKE